MLLPLKKLTGFRNAVSASAQMIAPLDNGYSYHRLMISARDAAGARTEAEMRTDIEHIKLIIKGRTKWHLTAAELIDLTQRYYYQLDCGNDFFQDKGLLILDLAPLWLRGQELALDLGLGMEDLTGDNDAIIEVKLTAATGITRLDLYGEVGPNAPAGVIRCVRRAAKTRSTTGDETEKYNLRADEAFIAQHVTLGSGPGVIDVDQGVDLLVNGQSVYQVRAAMLDQILRQSKRDPIASYVHFDPLMRGLYGNALFGGGRAGNKELGIPPQAPISSLVRKINWSTAPVNYVEITDTAEPALSTRG